MPSSSLHRRITARPLAGAALLAVLCSTPAPVMSQNGPYTFTSTYPITPVVQWWANSGYCGETSQVIAGMQYGQYLGQFDMRTIVTGGPQTGCGQPGPSNNQYTPGSGNEISSAAAIGLNIQSFPTCASFANGACSQAYLAWIKTNLRAGFTVTFVAFENWRVVPKHCAAAGMPVPTDSSHTCPGRWHHMPVSVYSPPTGSNEAASDAA